MKELLRPEPYRVGGDDDESVKVELRSTRSLFPVARARLFADSTGR
jgi:hypothetical protein